MIFSFEIPGMSRELWIAMGGRLEGQLSGGEEVASR